MGLAPRRQGGGHQRLGRRRRRELPFRLGFGQRDDGRAQDIRRCDLRFDDHGLRNRHRLRHDSDGATNGKPARQPPQAPSTARAPRTAPKLSSHRQAQLIDSGRHERHCAPQPPRVPEPPQEAARPQGAAATTGSRTTIDEFRHRHGRRRPFAGACYSVPRNPRRAAHRQPAERPVTRAEPAKSAAAPG